MSHAHRAAFLAAAVGSADAGDPESCKTVRFSHAGWTDMTANTSLAACIFPHAGDALEALLRSGPVERASMNA